MALCCCPIPKCICRPLSSACWLAYAIKHGRRSCHGWLFASLRLPFSPFNLELEGNSKHSSGRMPFLHSVRLFLKQDGPSMSSSSFFSLEPDVCVMLASAYGSRLDLSVMCPDPCPRRTPKLSILVLVSPHSSALSTVKTDHANFKHKHVNTPKSVAQRGSAVCAPYCPHVCI